MSTMLGTRRQESWGSISLGAGYSSALRSFQNGAGAHANSCPVKDDDISRTVMSKREKCWTTRSHTVLTYNSNAPG